MHSVAQNYTIRLQEEKQNLFQVFSKLNLSIRNSTKINGMKKVVKYE
jgi:L-rhamnose mutarotase